MPNSLTEAIKGIVKAAGVANFSSQSKLSKRRLKSTGPEREEILKQVVDSLKCPYCLSTNFVKRGWRQKKHERVQLYLCKSCSKTFTPHITKGKHYPLEIILEALSLYNLGYSLKRVSRIINQKNQKVDSISVLGR